MIEHSFLLDPKLAAEDVKTIGVFPRGYVSMVAGVPGVGKTWFMLDVCKSVADGVVGLGGHGKPYDKGKALIFAGETGVRMLISRMSLLGGIHNLQSVRVMSSHECARLDIDVMLNTAIGRKNIAQAIGEFRPDIVFFDTMISFMSGGKDESSQVDVTDPIKGLGMIASQYNCAFVLMHHYRKRAKKEADNTDRGIDDVIGSSALTRLSAVVAAIDRKGDVRQVRCLKSWWEEFKPFSFVIRRGVATSLELHEINGEYDLESSIAETSLTRKIINAAKEEFKTGVPFTMADVIAFTGASRNTVGLALRIAVAGHELWECGKVGNVRYYSVDEKASDNVIL